MQVPVVTYSKAEELANTISHAIGGVIAGIACVFLIFQSSELTEWGKVGIWVYAFSLVLAFTSSSLYHGTIDNRLKLLFKKLDHISIYFLISGSYTVLILNRLMNQEGYLFLFGLWGMTLVGIWFKARYVHRFKVFSTLLYVFMGYIMLFDPWLFFGALGREPKILLVLSGFFYTVGAGFYLWKSRSWTHFTWHIFVIIAAALHYAAVYVELI
ncbi:MAG: hemolysin III family protein [Flavobacteriales bacterium]|nr:hemolysin III family protein [Flavobacteriales bacterium]